MATSCHLQKWYNCDISTTTLPFLMKFSMVMHLGSTTRQLLKLMEFETARWLLVALLSIQCWLVTDRQTDNNTVLASHM